MLCMSWNITEKKKTNENYNVLVIAHFNTNIIYIFFFIIWLVSKHISELFIYLKIEVKLPYILILN